MTGVTHGADADRLQAIARALTGCAERMRDAGTCGNSSLGVLVDAWQGPDVEYFAQARQGAGRAIELAADHLQQTAAELLRRADDQTGVSSGISGGSPAGDPLSPEPSGGGGNGGGDDGDGGSGDGTKIGLTPSGMIDTLIKIGNLHMPEGLSVADPIAIELMQSPEGREQLQWLRDNDITFIRGGPSSQYSPGSDTVMLASDADVTSLIHEAAHARWDVEGMAVDIRSVERREYIDAQLDNEVNAMVAEVEFLRATSEDPEAITDQSYVDYTAAHEAALAEGASPEEADAAGRAAVRELFTSGYYEAGDSEESYPEYYGEARDERNP
ncbi:hypothetical protein LP422_01470 [Janibacter limosus]|nr:hypothetical protein LP422_01470 [Janibacter limosus]